MAPKRLESTLNSSFLQGSIDVSRSAGRPIDFAKQMEFEQLCEWLESKSDLLSMSEVHEELVCRSSDPDKVYSIKHLKSKLEVKYGDDLFFSEFDGRSNVLCFKPNANRIINDAWYRNRKETIESESERIIKTAAKLIMSDV